MGLFKRKESMEKAVNSYFRTIGGYTPTFTTFEGGLYEMELTRAAVHCIATHLSKLNPIISGTANPQIARALRRHPNRMQDTKKYLYRLGTLLAADNNVIIAPLYDEFYTRIIGLYPLKISKCELVEYEGRKYIRYRFEDGSAGAVPFDECGLLTQMQYEDELWGATNSVLKPTLDLLNARNQSIVESVKSNGKPRFIAKLAGVLNKKKVDELRQEFRADNFNAANDGGAIVVDGQYESVTQITASNYIVDSQQAAQIRESVYTYFGVNEAILQNKFDANGWNAFYEGKIEPIALEMSLVHTNMLFTDLEQSNGNKVRFYANRLEYMSNQEKLQMVTQMFDRGFLTHNQGLAIFDMPPVEGGDVYYIRKEYANVSDLHDINTNTIGGGGNADESGTGIQEPLDPAVGESTDNL